MDRSGFRIRTWPGGVVDVPPVWIHRARELHEHPAFIAIQLGELVELRELPAEFVLRELMAIKTPLTAGQAVEFVATYGLVRDPGVFTASDGELDLCGDEDPWRLWDIPRAAEIERELDALRGDPSALEAVESVALLDRQVRALQAMVLTWVARSNDDPAACVTAWTSRGFTSPADAQEACRRLEVLVNAGLTPYHVRVYLTGNEDRDLDSATVWNAACLQIANLIAENAAPRTCANETCGQLFYRQLGRAEHQQYRTTSVSYCTARCARAQAQRRYERRKREGKE